MPLCELNLKSEEYNSNNSAPAVQTVHVFYVVRIVKIKNSYKTCNSNKLYARYYNSSKKENNTMINVICTS